MSDQLPDISEDENPKTIWQRKKKNIRFSDSEVLMMLRTYNLHPCSWNQIIGSMKENSHQLPPDAQEYYRSSNTKQLKDRLSSKFSKLTSRPHDKIQNKMIRKELQKIEEMERKCIDEPKSSCAKKDKREALCRTLGSSSEEDVPARRQTLKPKQHVLVSSSDEDQGPSTSKVRKEKKNK